MTSNGQPRRRLFYGWWIALAGAFSMALSAGLNFYGFSAFFIPFTEEFKWSRTALSGVFSLSRLEGGILGPIEGYLTDKLGPRKVMLVGVPLMGLGFILLSRINSLTELYLVYVLTITIGVGLGSSTPVAAAVANWFHKKRSRAFGLLWSGVAIGGGGLVPLLTWIISTYGWRTATVVSGIIIFAVGLPVAMVMKHRPEHYGLLPDGAQPEPRRDESAVPPGQEPQQVREASEAEIGPRQCLKSPAFWFLAVSVSVRSIVISGIAIHFIPMMVDRGMSLTSAGSLFGAVAFLSIIGRLGLAWLGDLLDKRYLLVSTLAVMGLTMLALSQVKGFGQTAAVLAVYAVVYGGSTVLPLSLQADLFGRSSFATIRGLVNTVQTGGMIIGPLFAGFVYDTSQSYFIALLGFAAASFLAMILVLGARRRTADPARA